MKSLLAFLSILLLASCSAYQAEHFRPVQRLRSPALQGRGEIFYPNYRLPQRPYIETGIFTLVSHNYSSNGMEKNLEAKLSDQGFDAAVVLDKSNIPHPEFSASHELRYAGLVYLENFDRLGILDRVEIEYERAGSRHHSQVYFDWHGQIDSIQGSWSAFRKAALVQPWYFLEQRGAGWRTSIHSQLFPNRRLDQDSVRALFRYEPLAELIRYRIKNKIDREISLVYLEAVGANLILQGIVQDDQKLKVHSVFIDNHLREQRWQSADGNEKFRLVYHYKQAEDLPRRWLVYPNDLVK